MTTPPSRVRDVTAAATRARVGVDRRSRGGFRGGRRSRDRFESGAKRGAREIGDAPRKRRRRTRSLRHLGPSSRVRVPRVTRSANDRGDATLERRPASRGAGLDARRYEARVRMFRCAGRKRVGLYASAAETRATSGGSNRSSGQVFRLRAWPKTEILDHAFSSEARYRRICGVSPGSLTLGRAECSHRDSPRSCRGSRARSASTADARSTPLAPLAPEHACVPAGVVDPDTDASFRRVPFSSETAATASGPPPA